MEVADASDLRKPLFRQMLPGMQRILVIGSGGAGKSTAAVAIGAALGLPVIHLDARYWSAGWVPMESEAWRAHVMRLTREPAWVMDGNYGGTLPVRLAACDTVVFLDLSRWVCLARVVRRAWRHRGRSRPDMTPGCPERLTWAFMWWVWTYPSRRRPGVLQQCAALPASTKVHVLRRPRDVREFLDGLRQ